MLRAFLSRPACPCHRYVLCHVYCYVQALRPDMCIILKDQSLLYAFMQFLKGQGAVYILQFCLDVGKVYRLRVNMNFN